MSRLETISDTDNLRLHSLEEVPYIPREYLLVRNVKDTLDTKIADYEDIQDWLASILTHNKWIRVMDEIAACSIVGNFTRFELMPGGSIILVVRIHDFKMRGDK
jgi:hypothetical protein